MNLARQELPGMRCGHGPVPEGRLMHEPESFQSSLRDSIAVAIYSRQFLPGYIHAVPPGHEIVIAGKRKS